METIKKYLPWILVAIVGIYLIRKLSSSKPTILPQTQLTQTPQTDPFAELRLKGFETLANLGIVQEQEQTKRAQIASEQALGQSGINLAFQQAQNQLSLGQAGIAGDLQSRLKQLDIAQILGLKQSETELAQTGLQTELAKFLQQSQQNFQLQSLNAYLQQREQDRQVQQAAINRYYSSRNQGNIVGSIGQILGGIFGQGGLFGGSGGVYGTPPTFPSSGFDEGGFSIPPFLA